MGNLEICGMWTKFLNFQGSGKMGGKVSHLGRTLQERTISRQRLQDRIWNVGRVERDPEDENDDENEDVPEVVVHPAPDAGAGQAAAGIAFFTLNYIEFTSDSNCLNIFDFKQILHLDRLLR